MGKRMKKSEKKSIFTRIKDFFKSIFKRTDVKELSDRREEEFEVEQIGPNNFKIEKKIVIRGPKRMMSEENETKGKRFDLEDEKKNDLDSLKLNKEDLEKINDEDFSKEKESKEIDGKSILNPDKKEEANDNVVKIKMPEDLALEKLQLAYKCGYIKEEDIPEELKDKLLELYKRQNKDLQDKIKNERAILKKMIREMNNV